MKDLSKECRLSQSYTNHCIRVTTVNVMKEQGCSDDQISFVTGHKNSPSIIRYCRNRTDERYLTSSLALSAGKEKSCTILQDEKVLVMKRKSSGQQDETSSEKTVHLTGRFNNCTFNFWGKFLQCMDNLHPFYVYKFVVALPPYVAMQFLYSSMFIMLRIGWNIFHARSRRQKRFRQ